MTDDKKPECLVCGSKVDEAVVTRKQSNEASWMALAGREWFEYVCPNDGEVITTQIIRMS